MTGQQRGEEFGMKSSKRNRGWTNRKYMWGIIGVLSMTTITAKAKAQEETTSKPKAIVFFGVYTQWYRLDKALPEYELKICNAHSERVQDFPSVKEMFQAKLIILSDVSGGEFSETQVKQIKSFVERGGGLLVMGGPFTLGLGQFEEKGIAEMLPVVLTPFDLKWEREGKPFAKSSADFDITGNPMVYWIHYVKPKDGTTIWLTAGDYPLLITWGYGKGRVAVFTGTPMGLPFPGQQPFWEWEGWPKLIGGIAKQITSGEVAQ